MPRGRKPQPIADRLLAHTVVADSGCWEWCGSLDRKGYASMWVGSRLDGTRRRAYVHRLSYEMHVGPIPAGLHIDHLCRNTCCLRPDHLEPVTIRENVAVRGEGKVAQQLRQTHCKRGHEFTPENTYVARNRKRYCRTCQGIRQREYVLRRDALRD